MMIDARKLSVTKQNPISQRIKKTAEHKHEHYDYECRTFFIKLLK